MFLFGGSISVASATFCEGPLTETRSQSCATGYSGTITETRTKESDRYHSCGWGDWKETSNTCAINTYLFTVNMTGTGTGTVGGGGTFSYGTTATATATPNADSTFSGWSGDCDISGSVLIDGPKTCTATFTLNSIPEETYTVTATSGDNGTINPASQEAGSGTTVLFTVTPSTGYSASIGGTCPVGILVGTTYTTGNITGDCNVSATFSKIPEESDSFILTIETPGTGTGVVTGGGTYDSGTVVTATANPSEGSTFDGWSENCPNGVVTITSNTTCTATFTLKQSSSRHGSTGSIPKVVGKVLGAETTCGIYVDKFMRKGLKGNDEEAVKKVQIFLNDYMGSNLKVDGKFGVKTDAVLKAFQSKQSEKVLDPWGLNAPTGIFYLTTQTEVNNIMCPALNLPIPTLIPLEENPSFPKF